MKKVSLHGQLTFDEMKGSLERLPKTNRWVQMGDSLPWTEYEKVYNKQLKNDTVGASNRPGRMVVAALIIKHKLGLSDEETILAIQENPYMQYMCGLTEYSDRPIFDPSLFTTIRKRITIDDINALTLELARKARDRKEGEDKDKDDDGSNPPADTTAAYQSRDFFGSIRDTIRHDPTKSSMRTKKRRANPCLPTNIFAFHP